MTLLPKCNWYRAGEQQPQRVRTLTRHLYHTPSVRRLLLLGILAAGAGEGAADCVPFGPSSGLRFFFYALELALADTQPFD